MEGEVIKYSMYQFIPKEHVCLTVLTLDGMSSCITYTLHIQKKSHTHYYSFENLVFIYNLTLQFQ
jgi:hypothetical protein